MRSAFFVMGCLMVSLGATITQQIQLRHRVEVLEAQSAAVHVDYNNCEDHGNYTTCPIKNNEFVIPWSLNRGIPSPIAYFDGNGK